MTSKTVANNVNIDINNIENALTARAISARPGSARSLNRSHSAKSRPVIHEPCSSTLAKFHDGVNYSLINDPTTKRGSNTPRSNHPVLEAKQKFKYMTKTKSYVDETLFGGSSSRPGSGYYGQMTSRETDIYQHTRNHLTHDLMSNLAPLQIRPPLKTNRNDLNSARPESALANKEKENSSISNQVKAKPEPKPWKP